jgi:succinate-semialdehyde dehydrogenase/glutarate-semialdehyde dehydrogenase
MSNVSAFPGSEENNTVQTINPATGEVIKEWPLQTKDQALKVVKGAHQAFQQWRETDMNERAKIILKIASLLEKNKEELAKLMATEMGKPIAQGQGEIERCISICKYTAKEDYKNLTDEERPLEGGEKGIISYEPEGVILGIQPWNFPLYQVVRYSVCNLMAGNAVLLKHAKNVWGMAERVQEIYKEAGVPRGLFNVLYLENEEIDDLIGHDKIRGVTLTGSSEAGKSVASTAGKHLKKMVLELGGSDPYIILDDVDLDAIMETCVKGRVNNAGQTCVAAKRFIVLEDIYDEFKKKFVAAMGAVEYGDPQDPDTQMGPMARKDLRETLHKQVQKSIAKGAALLVGGDLPDGDGYFYPATVLENIKPGMPAYDDELFGPVAGLFKAKNEDDAVRIANDHRYGLGGGVMSGDQDRAIKLARRIDTGMVSINGYFGSQPNMPFGGVKQSGYGREHGGFGITEFVNIKSIYVGKS